LKCLKSGLETLVNKTYKNSESPWDAGKGNEVDAKSQLFLLGNAFIIFFYVNSKLTLNWSKKIREESTWITLKTLMRKITSIKMGKTMTLFFLRNQNETY